MSIDSPKLSGVPRRARRSRPGTASASWLMDVHAIHKSGTMFLYRFFRHLAAAGQYSLVSENHDPPDDYQNCQVKAARVCRCPIRSFEVASADGFPNHSRRRIFHLRDPRDVLVSEYFSFGWIHTTDQTPLDNRRREIQQMSIDEYVVRQSEECTWPVDAKLQPLLDYEFDPNREVVVKYEQMVTQFPLWCEQVVRHCGVRFPRMLARRLAWRYRHEFRTSGEAMQHKRRITPGDHREKLKPATIKILNQRFEPFLERFEYL